MFFCTLDIPVMARQRYVTPTLPSPLYLLITCVYSLEPSDLLRVFATPWNFLINDKT